VPNGEDFKWTVQKEGRKVATLSIGLPSFQTNLSFLEEEQVVVSDARK